MQPLMAMAGDSLMQRDTLTGSWGGMRDSLADQGLTAELGYTGEEVHNFSGGAFNRSGSLYHDNLDLTLTLDTEKAGLWSGGTLFVYGLRNHGGDPSATLIGDLQTASNIEAPDQFILHQVWYEQQLMDGKLSLLAGLHDLNSEFYVTEYGSLFLNSSFGIGPDMSANVPVSLFPKAGLGFRLRVKPTESSYLQAAVYDGDPSTRTLSSTEGHLVIGEAGMMANHGSYKLGVWQHSANITYAGRPYGSDYGAYAVVDQQLIELEGGASIGLFGQYGWAPANRNDVTRYIGAGLHVAGLIPGRSDDELGLAVARSDTHLDAETAVELTYLLTLTPWLSVQPSLQWIDNPGGDATVSTATVGLLRFSVAM